MLVSSSDFANYLSYVDGQWKNRSVCPFYQSGIYVSSEIVIQFNPAAGQEVETGTALDGVIFSPSTSSRSASQCPKCVDRPRSAGVVSRCLECFLSGGKLYRFQYGVSNGIFLHKCKENALLPLLIPPRLSSTVLKLFSRITVLEITNISRTTVRISRSIARQVILCTLELVAAGLVVR
ncbi:hypothetical protein P3S67_013417 [Capsicum chacoense]